MLLVDSHLDLAWNAIEWGRDIMQPVDAIRLAERDKVGAGRGRNTVSIPELHAAEVGLFLGTLLARQVVNRNPPFIPYPGPQEARQAALRQLECYRDLERSRVIRVVQDLSDLEDHLREWTSTAGNKPLGCIVSMEGADPIGAVSELREWWARGLRVIGPLHYGSNRYGQGTGGGGGLTNEGFRLLRAMDSLGFILDVTHLADQAMEEALDCFGGPVLASHHNCRALVPDQRQLTDQQIVRLVERQAVIGVALDAWMLRPGWVRGRSDPKTVELVSLLDHIDHICQLAGSTRHVGIGSDLDGGFGTEQSPGDLNTIADLQRLPAMLAERGYSESDVEGIMHRNWIDWFRRAWSGMGKQESGNGEPE